VTPTSPHLARLGAWIAGLDATGVPESARRAARLQMLDMVAAAHAGARSEDVASVVSGTSAYAGAGRATVLGTGARWTPADALYVNAACSMAQDFDDVVWMGHTCHSAVFASMAVAEHEGLSTPDMITAVVVANEIGGRIGASCLLGPLNGQMWTFIHLVSAAAATAWLLRLDADKATHALAIALAQPTFALQPGFLAPSSKLLAASIPAVTGMQAAYMARAGMTGAPDILEDSRGFWHRFSYLPLPFMLDHLGELWVMETLQVKTYPGCHYFQTACTALEALTDRLGPLEPEAVRRIRIDTNKLGAEASRFGGEYAADGPVTAVNACFDLATAAAIFLAGGGKLTAEQMEPSWLERHSAEVRRWRERIQVAHDPVLTGRVIASTQALPTGRAALRAVGARDVLALRRRYREEYRSNLFSVGEMAGWARVIGRRLGRKRRPAPEREPGPVAMAFPNRVTLELADGRVEVEERDVPTGCFASPGMQAALEQKFVRETMPALGDAGAQEAFAAGLHPDAMDLTELVRLMTARGAAHASSS
jgi:2-methylcitrate dehydratase PrpD